jgi:hypothetical protein
MKHSLHQVLLLLEPGAQHLLPADSLAPAPHGRVRVMSKEIFDEKITSRVADPYSVDTGTHGRRNYKDTNPQKPSLLVFLLGVV